MKSKNVLKYATATVTLLFLLTVASVTVNAEGIDSDEIVLHFSFEEPVITQIIIDNETYDQVTIEGLPSMGDIGTPVLPVKPVNVLLPQRGRVESIDVTYIGNISIGNGFIFELGQELNGRGSHPQNQSNVTIRYDVNTSFPSKICQMVGVYKFRGYSILTLNVFPVHYIGRTGELYYYEEITVTVKTNRTGSVNPLFRGSHEDEKMVQLKIDDDRMLSTYVLSPSFPGSPIQSSLVDPSESYDYVIITSNDLKNANDDYTFQDLMDYKNERFTRTTIVTIEDIVNDPYYWNTTNHLFNDTQARIRSFIQDAYLNWGIEYVLIGGDNDIIPTKILCFYKEWYYPDQYWRYQYGPSDLYYACLDGTFNSDCDVHWGEYDDGDDGGDIDLLAEIYIGRACVGNAYEVSNFVMKTLAYEETHDSYLSNVLMVGENLYPDMMGWGGNLLDELIDGSAFTGYQTVGIPSDEYNIDTLYDRNWTNHDWPKSEIINRINNNVHIIHHHGFTRHNIDMKMVFSDINSITNDKYFFIYSHMGKAGRFDDVDGSDCIAEHLTVKNNHGVFAGIWNSGEIQIFLSYPSCYEKAEQKIARQFWDSIYGESQYNPRMSEIGVANQDSKEDNLYNIFWDWRIRYRYFDLNLFGDPQVSIKPAVIPIHDIEVDRLHIVNYKTYVPSNETFTVNAVVQNKGTQFDTTIVVNFTIDGVTVEDKLISLLSNQAELVSFDCSLPSGIHQIVVDVQPVAGEDIISNNAVDMTIIAGPDIAVIDVDISPPYYIDNNNVINVCVGNFGVYDAEDVIVSLLFNEEVVNETIISSLPHGQTTTVSFNWIPEECILYNISVQVTPFMDENYIVNNYYNGLIHPVEHTVYVDADGNANFTSIQDAINWVGDGDTIFVYNGTYNENIIIYKSVSILGENRNQTVITGSEREDFIVGVFADGVIFSNFTVTTTGYVDSGIYVYSNSNVVRDNIIAAPDNDIIDVFIYLNSENNLIVDNANYNFGIIGIYVKSSFNTILRNNISQVYEGIEVDSDYNIIDENNIFNNTNGVLVKGLFNNVGRNKISRNSNGLWVGAYNSFGYGNTLSDNDIDNNLVGINLTYGSCNVFVGNNISENQEGVNVSDEDSFGNVFHHNNFVDNIDEFGVVRNAYDQGANVWDDEDSGGNFWSDFEDNPGYPDFYEIPGGDNIDNHPLQDVYSVVSTKPEKPLQPFGPSSGFVGLLFNFSASTVDLDGDPMYYLFEWDDGTNSGWLGPYDSGVECNASHVWDNQGMYAIQVKAKDMFGLESMWSDPFFMEIVNRPPCLPSMPDGETFGGAGGIGYSYSYSSVASDRDGDCLFYWFEWGDGTCSGWVGPYSSGDVASAAHKWQNPGYYSIIVKVKDDLGAEIGWSQSLVVTMNGAPEKPDVPDGPTSVHRGSWYTYTYSTSTDDPENEQVRYMWDWGDGPEEEWWGPYDSSVTVFQEHSWGLLDPGGDYYVKVQSKDVHGFKSVWSEPLKVYLPESVPDSCFLAGTKITMADGSYKNIEDIRVGDMVKSCDRFNDRLTGAKVKKIYHHSPKEMADYYLIINKDLQVTPNHPLYINKMWKNAGDARAGDRLLGDDGKFIRIESIERIYKQVPTYNFEIGTTGSSGTIVHTVIAQGSLASTNKVAVSVVTQELSMDMQGHQTYQQLLMRYD